MGEKDPKIGSFHTKVLWEKFSASTRFYVIGSSVTSAHLLFSSSPTHSSHSGLLKVSQIHLACPASAWLLPLPPSGLCLSVTVSETPTLAIPGMPNLPCPALTFSISLIIANMIDYDDDDYYLSTVPSLHPISAMKNFFVSFVNWCVPSAKNSAWNSPSANISHWWSWQDSDLTCPHRSLCLIHYTILYLLWM